MKGKNMKSVVGFLAGISLSSITMAETLTLQAAQEKLLAANPDLRIQREEQDKAEAQLSEARAAYWPSLDASASYQAFSKATEINIDMPAPIGGIHKTLGDKDREEYGIDLTYPLFLGGGRGQQIKARRSSVEAQGERVRAAENQTSLRLAALYYAWNQAEAARQSQESVAGFHREYADRIAKLVKGGAALPSREAAAKAKAVEEGKNLANKMGDAANMEQQKQVQNVVIQAMGFTPGFDSYGKVMMQDTVGYKPFTVYNNQKNVDNRRLGMGLYGPSDRLHNDLVNSQYKD